MSVMSGFRTPQYNARGGERGWACERRAATCTATPRTSSWTTIGDGRMDDLNRDGRIDSRDAQVILDAVEQVERAHATSSAASACIARRVRTGRSRTWTCAAPARAGGRGERPASARTRGSARIGAVLFFALATIGADPVLASGRRARPLPRLVEPRRRDHAGARRYCAAAVRIATRDAFGRSGEVKVRLRAARRARRVSRSRSPAAATRSRTSGCRRSTRPLAETPRVLTAAPTIAPQRPGFYHLAIIRGATREILAGADARRDGAVQRRSSAIR